MVTTRFVFALVGLLLAAPCWAQRVELLDFYLPTCPPCRAMAPVVDRLESEGVRVRRVDGSRETGLAARLQVVSYPTFVAVANGMEVGRVVGATSYERLGRLVAAAGGATRETKPVEFVGGPANRPAGRDMVATVGGDWGPGAPAPRTPATATSPTDQQLLNATVRLTIKEPGATAYGTGTLVDARQGEALIVTCAHLFRDEKGQPIETDGQLEIELFEAGRVAERVAGTLVSYDFDADVALVAIRTGRAIAAAPVAGSANPLQVGDPVRSVGCDLGADPTIRSGTVAALDRYLGPSNVEVTGAPTQGRSGGGLFDAQGQLVGVCNFADEQDDQGIYRAVASIHAQLDRVGLTDLYRAGGTGPSSAPVGQVASVPLPSGFDEPGEPRKLTPILRGQGPTTASPPAKPTGKMSKLERGTLGEIASRGAGGEVIVMIRPDEPGASTEVISLESASPAFLQALRDLGVATPVR